MNVLHVIPSFAPRYGGPIFAAVSLTRELARRGHDVTVATTNVDGPGELDVPVSRPVPMDGVDVWYFPIQRPRWYHFSAPMGRTLSRLVRESDVVHIHSIFLWPTTVTAFWCRRLGVPYLVHVAGSLDPVSLAKRYEGLRASAASRTKKWIYLNTLGRRDLGGAAALHLTSEVELESARRLRFSNGRLIPLGADAPPPPGVDDRAAVEQRYPVLQGRKVVLFLARLHPIKGLDVLAEAVEPLAERRDDFSLVVAGSGTPEYEAEVRAIYDRHGLSERTVFTGMVMGEEKWRLLRAADVFVLPSRHESSPVAVMEAMASGTPVVVSDQVGIHGEIDEAGAGLVTTLEPADVAGAIGRLLDDPDAAERMGRAGEALAARRYSWERVATDVEALYEEVVERARRETSPARTASE